MCDMKERKLGWVRDPEDKRDYGMRDFFFKANLNVPPSVDLRQWCSEVENQGDLGSCTGNGCAGALEFLEIKSGAQREKITQKSRLYIYFNGRPWYAKRLDQGACIRDVIKGLAKYGACNETVWPYDASKFAVTPSRESYVDGQRHQILLYAKLDDASPERTLAHIRETIASGFPVVFGFDVFDNAMSATCAVDGEVQVPTKTEIKQGGHCVLAVGYDDAKQVVVFRNSWGEKWSDKGYGTLPYWYVYNGHTADHWVIRSQENDAPGLLGAARGLANWAQVNWKLGRAMA